MFKDILFWYLQILKYNVYLIIININKGLIMIITENEILENIIPATKDIIQKYVKKETLHFSYNKAFKQIKITGHMESNIIHVKNENTWFTMYFNFNNCTYYVDVNICTSNVTNPTVSIYPTVVHKYKSGPEYGTLIADVVYLDKTK
jgi:hypothetical protein